LPAPYGLVITKIYPQLLRNIPSTMEYAKAVAVLCRQLPAD